MTDTTATTNPVTVHPSVTTGSVVVGVDGSEDACHALLWAARQADLEGRVLTVLHSSGLQDPFWTAPAMVGLDRLVADREEQAQAVLDEAVLRACTAHPELVVEEVLTPHDPRAALVAAGRSAAMVVLGSHGRGPVRSLLLGSVGVAVTQHAPCPVVVLRPSEPARPRHGVLAGTDGTSITRNVVEVAFGLASSRSWPLTVLECHVRDRPGAPPPGDGLEDTTPEGRGRALRSAVEVLSADHPDVRVEVRLDEGFLHQRLVELSPAMDAVVVGDRREGLLQRVVHGSLAQTVVEHASGVVVVVPVLPVT